LTLNIILSIHSAFSLSRDGAVEADDITILSIDGIDENITQRHAMNNVEYHTLSFPRRRESMFSTEKSALRCATAGMTCGKPV
jgi:hypothetical protein